MNKKRRFIEHYAFTRDLTASAREAGLSLPAALSYFYDPDVQKTLRGVLGQRRRSAEARHIFDRLFALAFGTSSDVLRLAFGGDELDGEALGKLDLSQVSTLKKLANGTVEVSFIDRLEAVRQLIAFCEVDEDKMAPLLRALRDSAADGGTEGVT